MSFGVGGKVIRPVGDANSVGIAVAIEPDRQIMIAGEAYLESDSLLHRGFGLLHLDPNGHADSLFGTGGQIVELLPGLHGLAGVHSMVRQPDGKYLVSGDNSFCCTSSFGTGQLVRFNANGSLDTTFGSGGFVRVTEADFGNLAYDIALQPDGKILVAGYTVIRLNPDGSRDESFGTAGEVNVFEGSSKAIQVQPDGRVVVAGTKHNGSLPSQLIVARLNGDGTPDSSFAQDGYFLGQTGVFEDLVIDSSGRIVVVGRNGSWALTRLLADGSLDETFGNHGNALRGVSGGSMTGNALAIQTNGKIVIAGSYSNGKAIGEGRMTGVALGRLLPDGDFDPGFGNEGRVIEASEDTNGVPESFADVAIQSDGSILAVGTIETDQTGDFGPFEQGEFAAARYVGDPVPTGPGEPDGPVYVALGDSVASGEGINYGFQWKPGGSGSGHWEHAGPDNAIWDGSVQDCHQSAQAYPNDLAITLNLDLTQLACTGSSSEFGLLKPGNNNIPPEPELGSGSSANATYDASKPDIVTLSVGADDLHFKDVVTNCYKSLSDCHPDPTNDLAAEKANLVEVLTEIKQRGEATGKVPLVLLTIYYDPFPAQYPPQPSDCVDLAPFHIPFTSKGLLSNYEMGVLRNDLLFLNHNIRSAAAQFSNVLVVDPPAAFQQHKWCSTDPWVYGPSIDAPSFEHPTGWDNPAPFHPTPEGQTAIADELASAISDAQIVPTGEDINVPLGSGASVTFDQVTSAGSVVLAPEGSGASLPPSDNHVRQSAFDIATSAGYQGNIRVSVPSSQSAELYHYTNSAWQQVADSTFDGHNVTGSVTSLSPFALGASAPQVYASFTETGAGEAPASVSFDASGSSVDSGGTIADYQWDFGDGTTGTGETPTHPYTRSGSYQVVLRATSDQGAVATASGIVVITNSPPTAAIGAPTQAAPSQVISFSGAESSDPNGSISDWVWDFGDSSGTQTGREVQHSYETPGTYAVTLIALDDEGAAGSATTQVQVSAPLAAPLSDIVPPDTRVAADTVPPDTRITSGPKRRGRKQKLRFRFTANEAGSAFRCKLDRHAFAPCVSSRTYRIKPGVHLFQVYAIDAAGNRDTTPARWKFKVTRRHRARVSGNV